MQVICAWCPRNGRPPADLGERAPLDDMQVTHGMCPACSVQFDKDLAAHATARRIALEANR